jgi:tetratricopeptide (TPR) repeat protein
LGAEKRDKALRDSALEQFHKAAETAGPLVPLKGLLGENDLIDAEMKIGDIYRDSKDYDKALAEYERGLSICADALRVNPQNLTLLRNQGKAFYRIADLLRLQEKTNEARGYFQKAFEVQDSLVKQNLAAAATAPEKKDSSLRSNLAATYTNWGLLEKNAGDLELALSKLKDGANLNKELADNEPANPQWLAFLAYNYREIASLLDEDLRRPEDALDYYQKLFAARRALAFRGLGPLKAQKDFAEAAKMLGDHSKGRAKIDPYRSAARVWGRMLEDPQPASVAAVSQQYDAVLSLAKALREQNDWSDAQYAYGVAKQIARKNYEANLSATEWRDRAEAAEKAFVEAGQAAATAGEKTDPGR